MNPGMANVATSGAARARYTMGTAGMASTRRMSREGSLVGLRNEKKAIISPKGSGYLQQRRTIKMPNRMAPQPPIVGYQNRKFNPCLKPQMWDHRSISSKVSK